jgi:glycosyltransferase involved in cell wall biosynthesis
VRELPEWCRWQPLGAGSRLGAKVRGLIRPRWESIRLDWEPPVGALAVADDPLSFPAVRTARPSVLTQHYLTRLDRDALGHWRRKDYQDHRSERWNVRHAGIVLAYSERVARALPAPAFAVPMAYEAPEEPLPIVEAPVAALIANWDWAPNRQALEWLLRCWPEVRLRVPGAKLLVAGRNSDQIAPGPLAGVEMLGPVADSTELLSQAAVMPFPCPDSSGPKVKVLEALALGLPVVTTAAGAEGLAVADGRDIALAPVDDFADALAGLLLDVERRAAMGRAGRQALIDHHAPLPAARARVAVLTRGLELLVETGGRR